MDAAPVGAGRFSAPKYRDNVVGKRLKLYWPHNQAWPIGRIKAYHPANGRHTLLFDNGEKTYILHKEKYQFLPEEGDEAVGVDLVDKEVLVWWADDQLWYHGTIDSCDGFMHGVLYDDGEHEFLQLDLHDYQVWEGGPPKEQPPPPANPKQVRSSPLDLRAAAAGGAPRHRSSSHQRQRSHHAAAKGGGGAVAARGGEGWAPTRMDQQDREAASVLLGFTAPQTISQEEEAAGGEDGSPVAAADPLLVDAAAPADDTPMADAEAAAAADPAVAAAGMPSSCNRASLGLRVRPKPTTPAADVLYDTDLPAVAPARAGQLGSLGGLVPQPTRRQRTGYPVTAAAGGMGGGGSKVPGLPNMKPLGAGHCTGLTGFGKPPSGSNVAASAAAAAVAAAAATAGSTRCTKSGVGLVAAMEELLKHVRDLEAKNSLEAAKRKSAEAERDVALAKLRAAQEELAAAHGGSGSGGASSGRPLSEFAPRDVLDLSGGAAALGSQAAAAALQQQLVQMSKVVAQCRQDSSYALAQVRELTSEVTAVRSAQAAAAVTAAGGAAVGGPVRSLSQPAAPASSRHNASEPLPNSNRAPHGRGVRGGTSSTGAPAAAAVTAPAAVGPNHVVAAPSPSAARKSRRLNLKAEVEEAGPAAAAADSHHQQQRDQSGDAAGGEAAPVQAAAAAGADGSGQQQHPGGLELSSSARSSPVRGAAARPGPAVQYPGAATTAPAAAAGGGGVDRVGIRRPGSRPGSGRVILQLNTPRQAAAISTGGPEAEGAGEAAASSSRPLANGDMAPAATTSIFSAASQPSPAEEPAQPPPPAAAAVGGEAAGAGGGTAAGTTAPVKHRLVLSSPERVGAKRTRAQAAVPAEAAPPPPPAAATDSGTAPEAAGEPPAETARKAARRQDSATPTSQGPVLVGPV